MSWQAKAFIRGALISVPIAIAVFIATSGKQPFGYVPESYGPLLLVCFVFVALWLGLANMVIRKFEKRGDGGENEK